MAWAKSSAAAASAAYFSRPIRSLAGRETRVSMSTPAYSAAFALS